MPIPSHDKTLTNVGVLVAGIFAYVTKKESSAPATLVAGIAIELGRCQQVQGYLTGRPLTAEAAAQLVLSTQM